MARKLPDLGEKLVAEIEAAWAQPQEAWARRRLLVVRLIAQHEFTVEQITRVAEVSRQSVFTYRDTLLAGGVAGALEPEMGAGPQADGAWGGGPGVYRPAGGRKVPTGPRCLGVDQKNARASS